jgi:hypothetical protein
MNIKDYIQPIQFIVYLIIIILGCGAGYASLTGRLGSIEKDLSVYKSDHDLLVQIATKVNILESDIKEIKGDIKQLSKELLHPY